MILKGSQRGGAKQLANHLLKTEENEHVELHEINGFISENLHQAFHETYAISRGTRCKQFFFSVSINPPQNERAPIEYFEYAASQIEERLNLKGQPRAIIFHEKEGRRHAHCVWSRIDAQEMKAINLPFYKQKLNDLSKELFLKYDWSLPKGFIDQQYSDPANFTLSEWQQAKRCGHDVKMIKALFRKAWEQSDCKQAFVNALKGYGFELAKGDRRGYVAIDYKQNVFSLSRYSGIKTKELQNRLGKPDTLSSVLEIKKEIGMKMTDTLHTYIREIKTSKEKDLEPYKNAAKEMTRQHAAARNTLQTRQKERWKHEETKRHDRLPKGLLKKALSFFKGEYSQIKKQNEFETIKNAQRDQQERDALIHTQLNERQKLQNKIESIEERHKEKEIQLWNDVEKYKTSPNKENDSPINFENQVAENSYVQDV